MGADPTWPGGLREREAGRCLWARPCLGPAPELHGFLLLASRLSITTCFPTPQARLSRAYVGLDSRGLEELPLEPERRKEAKYQHSRGGSGARPRSSACPPHACPPPHTHDGGPGSPAPPRARVDTGLIYYSPARSCGFPVLKIPRTRSEGYLFPAVTLPFPQQDR